MTKTLIGIDSDGVACIKITKGSINPVTEPDENVGSFLYNSKWAQDWKLQQIETTRQASGTVYSPAGTGLSNYKRATLDYENTTGRVMNCFRNSYFDGLLYDFPLFDIRRINKSSGRRIEVKRDISTSLADGFGNEAGYWTAPLGAGTGWYEDYHDDGITGPSSAMGAGIILDDYDATQDVLVVWRLPGDNTAIIDGISKAPVAGQEVIRITSGGVKVAKPGYDVNTATATQLAFDSSNRPAKIIYADDVALPLGTSTFSLGFSVPATTTLDLYLYETGGTLTFPISPVNNDLQAQYSFSGSTLTIVNTGALACRARFMVVAFDQGSTTSGDNDVLRQFTSGGENVVQFLRPGASASPSLSDIILDSRWPAIQILKSGYLSIAAVSNRDPSSSRAGVSQTVTFPTAGGVFPIVKYMTVHSHPTYGKVVRTPKTKIIDTYTNNFTYNAGSSTYCEVTGGSAKFWTFRGNPESERRPSGSSTSWSYDYPDDPIVGIRYYILGIPA